MDGCLGVDAHGLANRKLPDSGQSIRPRGDQERLAWHVGETKYATGGSLQLAIGREVLFPQPDRVRTISAGKLGGGFAPGDD